ncbi:MAG: SpoIIE family protein phosphatase [Bacteroidetes bacterium]|nr:SpoIIE family protein phosphatase [Bacteroidota bacterium]
MPKRISPYFFLLLFFLPVFSFAQHYNLKNYSIEDGLPQSQVMKIIQDSRGYLWLCTDGGGAARFDGKKFEVFNVENGMADNRVNTVYEDRKGNIWFGTFSGLTRWDGNKMEIFFNKINANANSINAICEDASGLLWLGSDKEGVWTFDGKNFKKISLTLGNGTPFNDGIKSILCTRDGTIWIASDGAVFSSKNDSLISYQQPRYDICSNGAWSLCEDHFNNIWIGSYGNFSCKYNKKKNSWQHIESSYGLSNGLILNMTEDRQRHLWVCTDGGGIYQFDNSKEDTLTLLQNITEKNGLPNDRVRCIMQDKEGNMWIGSDQGLTRYDLGAFTTYDRKDGLNNSYVLNIFEDSKNNLWFGSQRGVNVFDGTSFSDYAVDGKPVSNYVWKIFEDRDHTIWLGTYLGGAIKCDGKKSTVYTNDHGLPNSAIFDINQDHDGNIWLGTDYGIAFFWKDSLFYYNSVNGLNNCRVRSIFIDKKGIVWIGTRNGVLQFTPTGKKPLATDFKQIKINDKVDKSVVHSITGDDNGNIWFTTYGYGIIRYDPATGKSVELETKDGLSHNTVLSIVKDGKYFWIGTVNGINKFNVVLFDSTGEKSFQHFGKAEGFNGVECTQNSAFRDSKGNIWFGTGSGAIKYDARYETHNAIEPATHITGMRLFYEKTDWSKFADSVDHSTGMPFDLTLGYDQNHITFDFIGISLTSPEKVQYRYKLEGLDKDWSPPTTETFASYPGLPPGDYTFYVKACNNEGVWNKVPQSFSFSVDPPFYKTKVFYGFCILLLLSGGLGYSRVRTRSLRNAKKRLEKQVRARTAELHEKNITLENQKTVIEEKNKDITDSITYARKIQLSVLPPEDLVTKLFPESFILFKPRDIVSGDFYWVGERDKLKFFSVTDCTGHGVPGGFMSMLGITLLNEILAEKNIISPGLMLDELREQVIQALNRSRKEGEMPARDGMDISLCCIDEKNKKLHYAGANNPVYIVRGKELIELAPDKQPVGAHERIKPFTLQTVGLSTGDIIISASDGFPDQFNSETGKKFSYRKFRETLLLGAGLPIRDFGKMLEKEFDEWKGDEPQIDDVCVMGVKV